MAQAQPVKGDGDPSDNNGNSGLITSIDAIKEFNSRIIEVTKHLSICIGSVYKVDSSSYVNWGIGITEDNIDHLKKMSAFYYDKDYKERRRNSEIDETLRTDFKILHEWRMSEFIGVTVKELLTAMDDGERSFNICDVPCREGQLSAACAHALYRDWQTRGILERTVFHIVDLSGQKTDKAESTLGQFGARIHKYTANDEDLFERLSRESPGMFDIVFSLSHFHHKSFLVDFLKKVEKALAETGALVVGDWHSPLCTHPAHIQTLFMNLGIDSHRQDRFREVMSSLLRKNRESLEHEELKAMADHMLHWKDVFQNISEGTFAIKPRLYVNAAYDTSRKRNGKLEQAGFTTDLEKIRRAFPKAKLPEFSRSKAAVKTLVKGADTAAVMAAIKRR